MWDDWSLTGGWTLSPSSPVCLWTPPWPAALRSQCLSSISSPQILKLLGNLTRILSFKTLLGEFTLFLISMKMSISLNSWEAKYHSFQSASVITGRNWYFWLLRQRAWIWSPYADTALYRIVDAQKKKSIIFIIKTTIHSSYHYHLYHYMMTIYTIRP